MNLVDNRTQRHALVRRLLGAGSKEALAEYLAAVVLLPSLRRGENIDCMRQRGAAAAAKVAQLECGVSERRRNRAPRPKRSRAWRAAEAVLFPDDKDGGRGVDAPRTAG